VDRGGPKGFDGFHMGGGGVALVLVQSKMGIQLVVVSHEPVPADLGKDRGSRNRIFLAISLDDGMGLAGHIGWTAVAVDECTIVLCRCCCGRRPVVFVTVVVCDHIRPFLFDCEGRYNRNLQLPE
jgi:hypothetical protein